MTTVVDTNVLVRGKSLPQDKLLTIQEVLEEVESDQGRKKLSLYDINVKEPLEDYIKEVKNESNRINSPTSKTDEKLLALALQEDRKIITDDNALQNLALHLEVEFESYMGKKISSKRKWDYKCPSCGKKANKKCRDCGKKPIRKPK